MHRIQSNLLLFTMLFAASAQAIDDLSDQVSRCQAIQQDRARLSCFDALPTATSPASLTVAPAAGTPVAGAPAIRTPVVEAPTAVDAATVDAAAPTATTRTPVAAEVNPPVVSVPAQHEQTYPKTARIERISKNIDNRQVFFLDDGSIWRESRASRTSYEPGTTVTVEESGVLGRDSWKRYRLQIGNRSFSVVNIDDE